MPPDALILAQNAPKCDWRPGYARTLSLPPDIRAAASPAVFKKLLKTHIFNTAFSTC